MGSERDKPGTRGGSRRGAAEQKPGRRNEDRSAPSSAAPPDGRITSPSKSEVVYRVLKERILRVELYPGNRILIEEVSAELGVSPIPVREALNRLQAEGFVRIRPYAGAAVTELRPEAVVELFRLLEALEIISAQAACERLTDDELDALEEVVSEADALTAEPERWSSANVEFHKLICAMAGTALLGSLLERVLDHWVRLRRLYLRNVEPRLAERQSEHRELIAAMRKRDTFEVARVLHEHNRRALAEYAGYLKSHFALRDGALQADEMPVFAAAVHEE